jgi:hypothetical protein
MSPITLISMLLKHRLLRRSEEALHPLLSLMKAVTRLPMLNWLQWMSITFLIAGMRLIRTHPPPEILGHLALPQTPTHATRRECVAHLHTTRIIVVHHALDPYPLRLQYIPVVLVLQRITVIPPIEFKLPLVLLVHTALLMHTPGSQLVVAHQAIEKAAGNVVSGKGVEIRVDATLDISTMGRLHHLESTLPVRGAHRKLPLCCHNLHATTGIQDQLNPHHCSQGPLEHLLLAFGQHLVTAITGKIPLL